ncbi:MAG: hypothetical protein HY363_05005 [Candidatus Aenigmarchaeota archaeon]|nr:hypothetical protein [Candidatus Aenigmarchaeota archaeon]
MAIFAFGKVGPNDFKDSFQLAADLAFTRFSKGYAEGFIRGNSGRVLSKPIKELHAFEKSVMEGCRYLGRVDGDKIAIGEISRPVGSSIFLIREAYYYGFMIGMVLALLSNTSTYNLKLEESPILMLERTALNMIFLQIGKGDKTIKKILLNQMRNVQAKELNELGQRNFIRLRDKIDKAEVVTFIQDI